MAALLSRLADALEVDAVAHLGQHDAPGDLAGRYDDLVTTAVPDARWSPSLARVAASAVRVAVARFAMRGRLRAVVPVPAYLGAEDVLFLEVHSSGFGRLDVAVPVDAFDDVDRARLHLEEKTAEIFADDAERHELHAACE